MRIADIAAYGETIHRSSSAADYDGPFLPGFARRRGAARTPTAERRCCSTIDHIVGNVELGAMDKWVAYYEDVFGMTEMIHFSDEAISTEYSALMSKVVTSGNGRVKFPINEPAEGKRKSQIDEYLEFYEGAGAQHIALATRDIVGTVERARRRRGVEFLSTPETYYDEVPERVGEIDEPLADLRRLGHPRRPRRRGLPAPDLHQADRRPARRSSSRSSSATARAASATATSRRCSRRSSASRSGAGTSDALRSARRGPAQAPRAGPRRTAGCWSRR